MKEETTNELLTWPHAFVKYSVGTMPRYVRFYDEQNNLVNALPIESMPPNTAKHFAEQMKKQFLKYYNEKRKEASKNDPES